MGECKGAEDYGQNHKDGANGEQARNQQCSLGGMLPAASASALPCACPAWTEAQKQTKRDRHEMWKAMAISGAEAQGKAMDTTMSLPLGVDHADVHCSQATYATPH